MISCRRLFSKRWPETPSAVRRRWLSAASLRERLGAPVQAYVSSSRDPYVNLSIEHYLFQKSAPESTILFQYINRPSIIIGRNQNPWLEVNLSLLGQRQDRPDTEPPSLGSVDLVRRRSGGGTVFHDEGNVNWTVICPSTQFTRDKHVEMVVRALRSCRIERSRVNIRHDVVLDQGERVGDTDPDDTHVTPFTKTDEDAIRPLKVSGSAYKLTRGRALHHGTCLLSSPNLNIIPHYLHSPAKPYITARGVESVSSPVGNILQDNQAFMEAVQTQFAGMYYEGKSLQPEQLDDSLAGDGMISEGINELRSLEWTYLQTPQFTVSNKSDSTRSFDFEMTLRHGTITAGQLYEHAGDDASELGGTQLGQRLHEISSWETFLQQQLHTVDTTCRSEVLDWLQNILPVPQER